jgi:DNA polymerase I
MNHRPLKTAPWQKFQVYAFTDYGIVLTDEEAQAIRIAFFEKYPGLKPWHGDMREFVNEYGFVRAMHGAVRHLPNIWSEEDYVRSSTERQAINSPIQRLGSDMGVMATTHIARCAPPQIIRPNGFIHDNSTLFYREDKEEEVLRTNGSSTRMENRA